LKAWLVVLSEQAKADILDIHDYIAFELLSPESASKLTDKIVEATDELAIFPKKYPLCRFSKQKEKGHRAMSVGRQRIFYKILEETGVIMVTGVLYEGRNAAKIFSQDSFT